jgi:DNA-binding transcriptional LysR family regulator
LLIIEFETKNATLRQLKIFEIVARRLSCLRAAKGPHLIQPAVSTQMKTLEGHAGLPSFEQPAKKIYLTVAEGCCISLI